VLVLEENDPGVGPGVLLEDASCSVRGAVVDDDELEVTEGLVQDALGAAATKRSPL